MVLGGVMKGVVHAAVCGLTWRRSTLGLLYHDFSSSFLIIQHQLIIISLNLDIIALRLIVAFLLFIRHQILVIYHRL